MFHTFKDWVNKTEVAVNVSLVQRIEPNQTAPSNSSVLIFGPHDKLAVAGSFAATVKVVNNAHRT